MYKQKFTTKLILFLIREKALHYLTEFFKFFNSQGTLLYKLILKVGSPLETPELIFTKIIQRYKITNKARKVVLILRLLMIPSNLPFQLLNDAGLDLTNLCFFH